MDANKIKVLVVDDTEATRYAIARTLQANGFQTIEAATGQEALRLAQSEKPSLVTLDIHLPDMIGFEVCRRLKREPATAHIPVLQVSASYVTSKDRIHGLEGGADSYLTHPFEPPVLVATVKALLRGRELTEELRRSEDRFRVALENAPIMIYSCDTELRCTWMYNPPAPLKPEDFVGKKDEEIYSAEEAQELTAIKRQAVETNKGCRILRALTLFGQKKHYDLTIEPFSMPGNGVAGLTVACIDVTERVEGEETQRRATEEAELANRAKSRFLSNMSHEIRTPLGVIQGFADLALDRNTNPDDRAEYLTTIKRNAQNLTKLLGEILDLSKIEAGRVEFEKTRFDLHEMVNDVVSAFRLQAGEKGIGLSFEIEGTFPRFVQSDSTRTRQILINLIGNALKFTSRGGVKVKARMLPRASDRAAVVVEFDVEDSGIGIAPENQKRIFEDFTQADTSTTRRFGGTGLGLSLSKRLAQALGGDVTLAKSEVDRGSVFRFRLDVGLVPESDLATNLTGSRSLEAAAEAVASKPAPAALKGLRVLLVDDSPDNQMLFTRYLKDTGAVVDLASDGVEGVELARRHAYDIILMDVQMPNMDGYEATTLLRQEGLKTPIAALTAHAMKEDRERALSQGFTEYLIKPVTSKVLLSTLRKYAQSAEKAETP